MKCHRILLFLKGRKLFVSHGAVARPKIDSSLRKLLNTPAGTNGLIVDGYTGILLPVFIKPFGIYREGERRARAIQSDRIGIVTGKSSSDLLWQATILAASKRKPRSRVECLFITLLQV
jgi:hypothetical protein